MSDKEKITYDYDYSRATYYELIEKGRESLDLMIDVARESEHPRAFEVLSGLIKNISEVNDKLMDLNKKHKDVTNEKNDTKQITNNNVFLGSTSDLQRILAKHNDEKVIEVETASVQHESK
ncbi:terminase [bacterium]|nr:terminase [bacterium]